LVSSFRGFELTRSDEPSRSYAKPIPVITTYDDVPDNASRRGSKAGSIKNHGAGQRSASRAGSVRNSQVNGGYAGSNVGAGVGAGGAGNNVGDIIPQHRQQELQGGGDNNRGVQLQDGGVQERSMSPRPRSAFGYRPEPNLQAVAEDGRESGYGASGRDSRAGVLNRNGTVLSRSATLGRNGTLSRATNGGTVGSRRGAFGRGAGASIGTQPEEVLGRE
jgi:hypothetical protein